MSVLLKAQCRYSLDESLFIVNINIKHICLYQVIVQANMLCRSNSSSFYINPFQVLIYQFGLLFYSRIGTKQQLILIIRKSSCVNARGIPPAVSPGSGDTFPGWGHLPWLMEGVPTLDRGVPTEGTPPHQPEGRYLLHWLRGSSAPLNQCGVPRTKFL